MTPYKLKLLVCRMPYGGNGGIANEFPAVSQWLVETMGKISRDDRIDPDVKSAVITDTPATMSRNRFVQIARETGCDLILMIDSDQVPDVELGRDGLAKPFWDTAFDFVYKHYPKGPCVVGAPYCGPSPDQNVYVFQWTNYRNDVPDGNLRLSQYSREQAALMGGIQECAALPTGLILFDVRCFDLVEPPYFYYQYEGDGDKCPTCGVHKPGFQTHKSATEDVTATRDISLAGERQLGYNPVFCNWDAWAGHVKQEVVVKPRPTTTSEVSAKLCRAAESNVHRGRQLVHINPGGFENHRVDGVAVGPSDDWGAQQLAEISHRMKHARSDSHTPDGNATPGDEQRIREIVSPIKSGLIAEVGSFVGHRAKLMADASEDSHVVCVDIWACLEADSLGVVTMSQDVFAAWRENCKSHLASGRIEFLRGLSAEVAKALRHNGYDERFDAVYIDAGHTYASVKEDIESWLPLVKPGGVIFGHDFENAREDTGEIMFPGVRKAVEEIFGDDFERPPQGSSVWSHVKKADKRHESNGHAKKRKTKSRLSRAR